MKLDNKYTIFNNKDLDCLSDKQIESLADIADSIKQHRLRSGKKLKHYVCVSESSPVYYTVKGMVLDWLREIGEK